MVANTLRAFSQLQICFVDQDEIKKLCLESNCENFQWSAIDSFAYYYIFGMKQKGSSSKKVTIYPYLFIQGQLFVHRKIFNCLIQNLNHFIKTSQISTNVFCSMFCLKFKKEIFYFKYAFLIALLLPQENKVVTRVPTLK